MAEPEEMEEDLFADLYDADENTNNAPVNAATPVEPTAAVKAAPETKDQSGYGEEPETAGAPASFEDYNGNDYEETGEDDQQEASSHDHAQYNTVPSARDEPLQLKEDGKMFIGGLNWETTDESLYDYFSTFGEVQECTVMRDGASGRSRGFGFLTFKDPKVVNSVMVREHFLDGKIVRPTRFESTLEKQIELGSSPQAKIRGHPFNPRCTRQQKNRSLRMNNQIDPKRAIPRDEQEKTSKIFVGGVSQDATEADFTAFFEQFGRVVDATLMIDKDTGRPRGFGFVTFDSEAAVERCLEFHPLEIHGKPIEVKKAQPRGKMGEEEHDVRGGRRGKFGKEDRFDNQQANQQQPQPNQNMMGSGMTPQMMAQYWQKMQQYFAMMQQAVTANAMGGMNQMNPQMMAQMQQMQMQNMQGGNMQNMNPQMQQQMMQMMQMQNGMGMSNQRQMSANRPGFTAQEQQAFEQQKYEQQVARRQHGGWQGNRGSLNQNQGGPQSWEGMYDGEPQPDGGSQNGRSSVGAVRNNTPQGNRPPKGPTPQPSNAPANAPTGPKNAGKPGANFRGGRGGRYHPYGR